MTMTQSEALARGGAGRDRDSMVDRRRSRLLAKVLDHAFKLHEHREPVAILTAFETSLTSLFPGAHFLLKTRSDLRPDTGAGVQQTIVRTNLADAEIGIRRDLAERVTRAGVPSFEADLDLDDEVLASCVPIKTENRIFGAVYLAIPSGQFATSDELTTILRHFAGQLALALHAAADIRVRREDMEIMATETGASLVGSDLSLTDAKRAFEHWLVSARLKEARGNIAAAARSLHMDRGQLSRLVKRHAIEARAFKG